MLPKCKQNDSASIENGANTHCDSLSRNIPLTEEVTGGVSPRDAIECYESCSTFETAARLIKSYVASPTYTEKL